MIRVYTEPVHNNPPINNIDNEAHKKIRDDFYWVCRYLNFIPCIMANLFIIVELKFELLSRRDR